jgi:hypothetical protein
MPHGSNDLYSFIEPVTRKHFGQGAKKHPAQFSQFMDVSSTTEPIREFQENAGAAGTFALKTENSAMSRKVITPGPSKRVQAATYAAAIEFSKEILDDIRDSQNAAALRKVTTSSGALGRSGSLTPEYLVAQFLDRSFTSGYPVTVDNVILCSASHVSPLGTTYSNIMATPAALSETSLEDIMTQLRTTAAADGLLTPVMPELLIVPSALANTAKKLTMSEKTLGTANNDPSIVRDTAKHVVFDYLVNQTRYFMKTDADNGLYWQWRQALSYDRDNVALTMQAIFIAFFRAMWGCEDPRGIFGVNAT